MMFTDLDKLIERLEDPEAYVDAVDEAITAIRRLADYQQSTIDLCNNLWGLLYPNDPTGWEYMTQPLVHIRVELEQLRAERDRLKATLVNKDAVLEPYRMEVEDLIVKNAKLRAALGHTSTLLNALRMDNNIGAILSEQQKEAYKFVDDLVKVALS
jgi:hypothetical protein